MSEDMCPICRSSRYLNPDMQLLVNPECYHKMCAACVDRIYTVGPAPCPYVGCGKILRKSRFKIQVFDDLKVEREVDVRNRVCRVFNRPEEAFASGREYDDYLERIESVIFAISEGTEDEKKAAERELADYESTNKQEILQNALQQKQDGQIADSMAAKEAENQRRLRQLAIELQQKEEEISHRMQEDTLTALETSNASDKAIEQVRARTQEQLKELREEYEKELGRAKQTRTKRPTVRSKEIPSTPFTPFLGDRQLTSLYSQADTYMDPTMTKSTDPFVRAGGFTPQYAQREALTLAFMSLEVDVQREKAAT